ncbi:hypothetical protein WDW86_15250 [Bdellovibrionota bacterium FG-2]
MASRIFPFIFALMLSPSLSQTAEAMGKTSVAPPPTDLPAVCASTSHFLVGLAFQNTAAQAGVQNATDSNELQEYLTGILGHYRGEVPWFLSMSESPILQKAGFEYQLELARRYAVLFPGSPRSVRQIIETASASNLPSYSDESVGKTHSAIDDLLVLPEYENQLRIAKKGATYLCSDFPNAPHCKTAFLGILEQMHPRISGETSAGIRTGISVSLLSELEEVFSDPSYLQGSARAALTVLDKIQAIEREGPPPGGAGDILSDLTQGFMDSGQSVTDAQNHAWKLLAIYATRGATIHPLHVFSSTQSGPVMIALYVLSSGISFLNNLTLQSAHAYGIPKELSSHCSYGKLYHFWLAAYLARSAYQKGADPLSAATASHLAAMGYEYAAISTGRNPEENFSKNIFSPYANGTRLNIAFNDAGAVFGSLSAVGKTIDPFDLDQGLASLFSNAKPFNGGFWNWIKRTMGNSNSIGRFLLWKQAYAPHAAINDFIDQTRLDTVQ